MCDFNIGDRLLKIETHSNTESASSISPAYDTGLADSSANDRNLANLLPNKEGTNECKAACSRFDGNVSTHYLPNLKAGTRLNLIWP